MRTTSPARLVPFLALALVVAGTAPAAGLAQPGADDARAPESPIRGLPGDWWADVILGHPEFSEITPNEVTGFRVFNVGGVLVDRSTHPNRVYVHDGGNSRVLGLSHLGLCALGSAPGQPCTADSDCPGGACAIEAPVEADLVIGQPSLQGSSACNGDGNFQNYPLRAPASASTLCTLPVDQISTLEGGAFGNMAVDAQGNLYVPDWWNHRVLRYDRPFETDTVADAVWGQPNFSGQSCNEGRGLESPSISSLCLASPYNEGFVGGVAVDHAGNLWVTDNQNCRVLRFPAGEPRGVAGDTADMVLGQPDFTSWGCGSEPDRMFAPAAVRVDATGSVYVADSLNNRVLIFDPPLSSGMAASRLLGANLRFPTGLEWNPAGGIWVNDTGNHQVLLFQEGVVTRVLLKDVPTYDGNCGGAFSCAGGWYCAMCDSRGSIGIDVDGNVILADSDGTQDVWRFPAPIPEPTPGVAHAADVRLFAPVLWGVHNHLGAGGLYSPRGVEVSDGQLIVTDHGRMLFWDTADLSANGQAAQGCAGTPDCAALAAQPYGRLQADAGRHLWVVYGPEIHLHMLPLLPGNRPVQILASPLPAQGGGSFSWTSAINVGDVAVTGDGGQLWIADPGANRVFRISHPLSNPIVDVVLGQANLAGDLCNRGQPAPAADTLCTPGAVALDPWGNLYVSDHALEISGNHRLLEYDASLFPVEPATTLFSVAATRVFGTGGRFDVPGCTDGTDPLCEPLDLAFDSRGRMVVGLNGYSGLRFPLVYDNPLANPLPAAVVKDYGSMPYAAAFDESDNLYLADLNRHRVLVYWQPDVAPSSVYLPLIVHSGP